MNLKIDLYVEDSSGKIETPDIEAAVIKKLEMSCSDLMPVIKAYENLSKMPMTERIAFGTLEI